MKAKTYAADFIDRPSPEKAGEILDAMMHESLALIEKRRCNSDAAYQAVFQELEMKWKAFARIVNEYFQPMQLIRPEGFMEACRDMYKQDPVLAKKVLPTYFQVDSPLIEGTSKSSNTSN